MAVEVYWWVNLPGHVALRVDGGLPLGPMYLSRWPNTLATELVIGYEGKANSFADDMIAEGGHRPFVVRLTKLNETAVKKAIVLANRVMVYNDFQANCSSHVRACLDAGVGGVVGSLAHGGLVGFAMSDNPVGVFSYAKSLEALYG